jgi:hypothetical protein
MDNQRPVLDLKYFKDICPDSNGMSPITMNLQWCQWLTYHIEVPVIAVFTKFDQFKINVEMDLEDHPKENLDGNLAEIAEKRFKENYLHPLGEGARYVRLESAFRAKCFIYMLIFFWQKCTS